MTFYYYHGVNKYKHVETDGYESWSEYDSNYNLIRYKDSDGVTVYGDPVKTKTKKQLTPKTLTEADVKPFEFSN